MGYHKNCTHTHEHGTVIFVNTSSPGALTAITDWLHINGSPEFPSAALEPLVYRKWRTGIHWCGAGTVMLHQHGALESTSVALEP